MKIKNKSVGEIDVYVGARLKQRRTQLGFSQEKLALGVGLTFQQVQKYEKGANRISVSRLIQFATILASTPTWFLKDAPGTGALPAESASGLATARFLGEQDGARFMAQWSKLNRPKRLAIVALVEAVAAGE